MSQVQQSGGAYPALQVHPALTVQLSKPPVTVFSMHSVHAMSCAHVKLQYTCKGHGPIHACGEIFNLAVTNRYLTQTMCVCVCVCVCVYMCMHMCACVCACEKINPLF